MSKKANKGSTEPQSTTRNFNARELAQLQELHRVCMARRFEIAQIKANTAAVPRGQKVAAEMEAIVLLLENARANYIAEMLVVCGYPQGKKFAVDLQTGAITPDES